MDQLRDFSTLEMESKINTWYLNIMLDNVFDL